MPQIQKPRKRKEPPWPHSTAALFASGSNADG